MNKKTLIALLLLTFFVLIAMSSATFLLVTRSGEVSGSLTNAKSYKPTSQWIEEGLDPNVTQFGFDAKSGKKKAPTGKKVSDADVYNLIQTKHHDLMPCYVDGLEDDDELQGKVDMQFGIAPDGHIAMVKVTGSSMRSKKTEDCFVKAARNWSFPATGRSTLMKFDTDFAFAYE